MSFLVVGGMGDLGAVAARTASQIAAQAKASKAKPKPRDDDDDDGATANQVIGIASQVAQGYNAYQAERRAELEAQRPVVYAPQPPPSSGLPPWAPWAAAGAAAFLALLTAASSRR